MKHPALVAPLYACLLKWGGSVVVVVVVLVVIFTTVAMDTGHSYLRIFSYVSDFEDII